MPSPFPGMDPYLEDPATWSSFHFDLIAKTKDALFQGLRPRYFVRSEDRVYVVDGDEVREHYLEIQDARDRQLVTILEVLSPSNKTTGSEGRASFGRKRTEIMISGMHWVEIDLLRAGQRFVSEDILGDADYYAHVSHVDERPQGYVWPIRLTEKLPVINIPLRGSDPSFKLDLQLVLSAAYEASAFDETIDYSQPPIPPLSPKFEAWANELLRMNGLRT